MSFINFAPSYLTIEAIGQSNTQGARLASELPGDMNGGTIEGALCYNQYTEEIETLSLANNNQGTKQVTPAGVQSFGCELFLFKNLVARFPNLTPCLIKYSLGGTSLVPGASDSSVSAYNWSPSDSLRPDALENHNLGLGKLGISSVDFVYFIQAEQETQSSSYYNAYPAALLVFANHILSTRPKAILIIVSLSNDQTGLNGSGVAAIQTAQQAVAGVIYNPYTKVFSANSGGLSRVVCIRQNELTVSADKIHYTVTGYRNLATYIEEVIVEYY